MKQTNNTVKTEPTKTINPDIEEGEPWPPEPHSHDREEGEPCGLDEYDDDADREEGEPCDPEDDDA